MRNAIWTPTWLIPIRIKNDNCVASPCRAAALSAASRLVLFSNANWNDTVASTLKSERLRVVAEESKKARLAAADELDGKARELAELQDLLKVKDVKLAEAQKAQADLIKKQRALDDAQRKLELTI